jgi:hypothetical protein
MPRRRGVLEASLRRRLSRHRNLGTSLDPSREAEQTSACESHGRTSLNERTEDAVILDELERKGF